MTRRRRDGDGLPLLRDVGGLPAGRGSMIRTGCAFRISGQIVTPAQLDALSDAGVEVVVDLRALEEDRSVVMTWAQQTGIRYRHEPIPAASQVQFGDRLRAGLTSAEAHEVMREIYLWIVDTHGAEIAATLGVIAEGKPTGFGCAAGRDRTGVVSALLQSLLGADDREIASAYSAAAPDPDKLAPTMRALLALGPEDALPVGTEVILGSSEGWILDTLAHVRDSHGSVGRYLAVHGLEADAVARLRGHLLVQM